MGIVTESACNPPTELRQRSHPVSDWRSLNTVRSNPFLLVTFLPTAQSQSQDRSVGETKPVPRQRQKLNLPLKRKPMRFCFAQNLKKSSDYISEIYMLPIVHKFHKITVFNPVSQRRMCSSPSSSSTSIVNHRLSHVPVLLCCQAPLL